MITVVWRWRWWSWSWKWWWRWSLLQNGSSFGDPGPHGNLFGDLGPLWVPFSCFGSPFSILDWITQRIAVRTIVESSQNQCKDGRTECPFPPRCGSAYENWPPLCNFDMLILCLKFNFDSVSLLFNRFALCELFWKIELWVPFWVPFYIIWVPFWSPLCLKLGPLWVPFLGFWVPFWFCNSGW